MVTSMPLLRRFLILFSVSHACSGSGIAGNAAGKRRHLVVSSLSAIKPSEAAQGKDRVKSVSSLRHRARNGADVLLKTSAVVESRNISDTVSAQNRTVAAVKFSEVIAPNISDTVSAQNRKDGADKFSEAVKIDRISSALPSNGHDSGNVQFKENHISAGQRATVAPQHETEGYAPPKPDDENEDQKKMPFGLPMILWALICTVVAMLAYVACIPFILTMAKRRPRPAYSGSSGG